MNDSAERTMLEIVSSEMIVDEIVEVLQEHGVTHYTEFDHARGVGESGPVVGSMVWPGENSVIMAVIDNAAHGERVAAALKLLRDRRRAVRPGTGIRVFAVPCHQLL